jgi:hypothetical protein
VLVGVLLALVLLLALTQIAFAWWPPPPPPLYVPPEELRAASDAVWSVARERAAAAKAEAEAEAGAEAETETKTARFRGTRVPRRVVVTYHAPTLDALPPALRDAAESWRQDAQAPELVYYSDLDARAFLAAHFSPCVVRAFDVLVPGAFKADLFRLCEILVRGGVYVDVKATRLAPLSAFMGERGFVVVDLPSSGGGVYNACFAAAPGAEWVAHALCIVLENVMTQRYGQNAYDITGPAACGRGLRVALGADASTTYSCAHLVQDPQSLASHGLAVLALAQDLSIVPAQHPGTALATMANAAYRKHQQQAPATPTSDYNLAWRTRQVFAPR